MKRALAGGADEVIVNDSHDGMRNLVPDELHRELRFIPGAGKPLGMMQGVDLPGIGAVFYTGYPAKAGTPAKPAPAAPAKPAAPAPAAPRAALFAALQKPLHAGPAMT